MIKAAKIYCLALMWTSGIGAIGALIVGEYLLMVLFIILYILERIGWNELNG